MGRSVPDPRVQGRVDDVRRQVGDHDDHHTDHRRGLDERQVAPLDGEQRQPAQASIAERRVTDDRPADQRRASNVNLEADLVTAAAATIG
jgi:hypothetical protein